MGVIGVRIGVADGETTISDRSLSSINHGYLLTLSRMQNTKIGSLPNRRFFSIYPRTFLLH